MRVAIPVRPGRSTVLIRTHLDGHPDRWLRLAELLRANPTASDEALIVEAAGLL